MLAKPLCTHLVPRWGPTSAGDSGTKEGPAIGQAVKGLRGIIHRRGRGACSLWHSQGWDHLRAVYSYTKMGALKTVQTNTLSPGRQGKEEQWPQKAAWKIQVGHKDYLFHFNLS